MKFIKLFIACSILCFSFGAQQVAHADGYPIGSPITNYSSKTCMAAPDIVITIYEMSISGEPIAKQVRIQRQICEYRDADGKVLGWGYEIVGGNWY